jgi:hypothetical protein
MQRLIMAVMAVIVPLAFTAPIFADDEKKQEEKKGGNVLVYDEEKKKDETKPGK